MNTKELIEKKDKKNHSLANFWEECSQKTKPDIIDLLIAHLGKPKNELENNCLDALARKVLYFYNEEKDGRSKAVSSLIGQVTEITQKEFKDGRRKGQIYYLIKLERNTTLRAAKEDLTAEKWTQIEKLAILEQNLVFKYRKWIIHKDIVDFYPA